MTAGRWPQVERLYHEALEQPPAARLAFVDRACSGDSALRDEVLSLLACDSAASVFLEQPALEAARLFAADHARLIGHEIGGYRISALLGCGGMGEVYQARDLRLERDVAVKVVAEGMDGDAAYVRRFEEEARSASCLNHPNIVTIHGVGEQDGVAFIAMELVLGTTLRQMLDGGPLSLAAAWDLAIQLADALAAAHAAGIVHRDLKPDNIMVTPNGLLKVLDFGIARRDRGQAVTGIGRPFELQTGLTSAGEILGTAGYMSPEQAAGRPADGASDQFSFAAILYEMLTAQRAFARGTPRDTIAAIVNDEPVPVETRNPSVPPVLRQVLVRAFRKSPGERYGDTREIAAALRKGRDQWHRAQTGGVTRRQALTAVAAVAATVASGGAVWAVAFRDRGIRSLAVLPFVNATRDARADYLADGLTEGLIRRLSLPSLRVAARSSVFNFKARGAAALTAGRQLGVDAILTGSVEQAEGRLRIRAELIQLATGTALWARTYDRGAGDALLLQEDIVRGVLDEGVRFRATDADRQALERPATADVAAYDLYLRGLSIFRRDTEADYLAAQTLLQQAVEKDPTFADGYAALAATYSVLAIDGYMRPNDAWAGSVSSATRAIALDRDVPNAHAELGSGFFFFYWDWTLAERAWETARHARGGRYEPDFLIAYALERWATGRPQAALDLARQARELDPVGPAWALRQADFLLANHNLDQAARIYELLTEELPADPRAYFGLAEVRRREGRFDEASAGLAAGHAAAGNSALQAIFATAHGEAGFRRIERITVQLQLEDLRKREADGRYVSPLDFARVHAQLGETARALEFFPAALDERSPGLVFLNVDRVWDGMRSEPLFRKAVSKVKLAS